MRFCFLKKCGALSGQRIANFSTTNTSMTANVSKRVSECRQIFELYADPKTQRISLKAFLKVLRENGLRAESDSRISPIIEKFREVAVERDPSLEDAACLNLQDLLFDEHEFTRCISCHIRVVRKMARNDLVIPDWQKFSNKIGDIYQYCKQYKHGKRVNPEKWALSICTVDGQQKNWGDHRQTFCLQSVSKPFMYSLAIEELGADYVHRYVGQEPSGQLFNEICLDQSSKPHNPMINSGAIIITSMLRPQDPLSDRFDFTKKAIRRFAGGRFVSFDNATFLSEKETADRNYALAYFMREHKCFPVRPAKVQDILDLYFQFCSIKTNTESLAIMAATLANGGVNPLTEERVVCNLAMRDTLSLMLSCGMYDYSGQFAFKVGLPAKSGVSGNMIIVVPNVMGIALYSPRLDVYGNSVRGVKFADELVQTFNFHHYDNILFSRGTRIDPRLKITPYSRFSNLMYAIYNNDILTIKRELLIGVKLDETDYNYRNGLHVAASEGYRECLEFLLSRWGSSPIDAKDKFGATPLDNALQFGHTECAKILENNLREQKLKTNEHT